MNESVAARKARLETLRQDTIKRDLNGLPGFGTYLKESLFTPKWRCSICGTMWIPCTLSTCPQCGNERPANIADPEIDDVNEVGIDRAAAGQRKK